MARFKLALLAVGLCLVGLLSGCGGSSSQPPAPLAIATTTLPQGVNNVQYNATLTAAGGVPSYAWTVAQGSLPSGLTLNATSGMISGTPTAAGTSSFTVQASDAEIPAATATAGLSITINPAPPRNAALYISGQQIPSQTGLQIQSDGSLTLLASSPESAITGFSFAASPTAPLLFVLGATLDSLLVNSDYSLSSYSSTALPGGSSSSYQPPSVDPTGSNVYLPGPINGSGATGVTILPGNGALQALSNVTIPNVVFSGRMVFTPDSTLAFIPACAAPPSSEGSILSLSRSSDGTLAVVSTYTAASCVGAMAVSPDGKYLATSEMQIYSIGSSGALSAVLSQPFTITQYGNTLTVLDLTWDSSGSYLVVATSALQIFGGVAVAQFSGSALTETVPPTGFRVGRLQWAGSSIYSMGLGVCINLCQAGPYGVLGFDFQNGQLIPLHGSPYQYGDGGDMVVY
jgi:Putative Ig domain